MIGKLMEVDYFGYYVESETKTKSQTIRHA